MGTPLYLPIRVSALMSHVANTPFPAPFIRDFWRTKHSTYMSCIPTGIFSGFEVCLDGCAWLDFFLDVWDVWDLGDLRLECFRETCAGLAPNAMYGSSWDFRHTIARSRCASARDSIVLCHINIFLFLKVLAISSALHVWRLPPLPSL